MGPALYLEDEDEDEIVLLTGALDYCVVVVDSCVHVIQFCHVLYVYNTVTDTQKRR